MLGRFFRANRGNFKIVRPGKVSPQKQVPQSIPKPSYHVTGEPTELIFKPEIKNGDKLARMRESCKLAAEILRKAGEFVEVGQTTDALDNYIHDQIISAGAYPSPLNYKNFPKSVCTSVNNVACHGIPDDRALEDGDIINVDITVFYKGFHGDCSKTFLIGNVDDVGKKLVETTEACLKGAVAICEPGRLFKEIGYTIQEQAQSNGYTVIPVFIGHGIGHYFHGPPDIFHIENDYEGAMQSGMTFTIEPILTTGSQEIEILEDNWTAVTCDSNRTAQFEHTILITDNGVEILTL